MPDLIIRTARPEDMPRVRDLCRAYRDVLVERSTDIPEFVAHYYAKADFEDLLTSLEEKHAPPKGAIYVAEIAETITGCAMTHEVAPGVTEIKRVYVTEAARGSGAATALFRRAIADAKAAGQRKFVLDTMVNLTEAVALYGKLGLTPTEPFYELDPRLAHVIRFFGTDL